MKDLLLGLLTLPLAVYATGRMGGMHGGGGDPRSDDFVKIGRAIQGTLTARGDSSSPSQRELNDLLNKIEASLAGQSPLLEFQDGWSVRCHGVAKPACVSDGKIAVAGDYWDSANLRDQLRVVTMETWMLSGKGAVRYSEAAGVADRVLATNFQLEPSLSAGFREYHSGAPVVNAKRGGLSSVTPVQYAAASQGAQTASSGTAPLTPYERLEFEFYSGVPARLSDIPTYSERESGSRKLNAVNVFKDTTEAEMRPESRGSIAYVHEMDYFTATCDVPGHINSKAAMGPLFPPVIAPPTAPSVGVALILGRSPKIGNMTWYDVRNTCLENFQKQQLTEGTTGLTSRFGLSEPYNTAEIRKSRDGRFLVMQVRMGIIYYVYLWYQ